MATSTQTVDYTIAGLTAPQFCTYMLENRLESLYAQIPDQFIHQAAAGFDYFEIDSELIELDLIRIPLLNAKRTAKGVSLKFKLNGVLNMGTGELEPMTKNLIGHQQYLQGFNSLTVKAGEDLFSTSDWNLLNVYADWWQETSKNEGNGVMYSKYFSNRLWLKPMNSTFKFQFKLDVRRNPSNGDHVLGLSADVKLRGVTFMDTFSGLIPEACVNEIETSKGQRTGRLKVAAAKGIRLPNR